MPRSSRACLYCDEGFGIDAEGVRAIVIPILDFAWQDVRPVEFSNPQLGDIHAQCVQYGPELLLAHDVVNRWSALIIPEVVDRLVAEFEIPVTASATASGVVDVLRQGHITVSGDQPASMVVRLAQSMDAAVVVIADGADRPVGLFLPAVVAERLSRTSLVRHESSPFVQYVAERAEGDLVAAISAIESEHTSFHSESLNQNVSDAYICDGGGIPHHVAFCPHRPHPSGPCGHRRVARPVP